MTPPGESARGMCQIASTIRHGKCVPRAPSSAMTAFATFRFTAAAADPTHVAGAGRDASQASGSCTGHLSWWPESVRRGPLRRPFSGRVPRDTDGVGWAIADLEDEDHVDADTQQAGADGEARTRQHRLCLRPAELPPVVRSRRVTGSRPARGRMFHTAAAATRQPSPISSP